MSNETMNGHVPKFDVKPCPHCKADNWTYNTFCMNCGAELEPHKP